MLKNFCQDEDGATAIEYGLIASLFVLVILVGLTAFGNATTAKWTYIETSVSTATSGS